MEAEDSPQFTARAVVAGVAVGTIVCFSNMYFGLQTGWVSMMSMPSSLIGFAIFKSLSPHLAFPFTPVENVLVQTVAVAVGSMPLSAGYVGVIPALERLLRPEEGGPIILSMQKLMFWGLGIAFFGVFFAVPLRRQVIIREKLKFPSGTATALMISILHGTDQKKTDTEEEEASHFSNNTGSTLQTGAEPGWEHKTRLLLYAFAVSGGYTLLSFFVPVLRNFPLFGSVAAKTWLWTLNPSPAYVGQGIIMGPETTGHMLLGAVIGWAVLSPLAKHKGWAPGDVDDRQTGSRGWIVWVSLAIMLTDSILSLSSLVVDYTLGHIRSIQQEHHHQRRGSYQPLIPASEHEESATSGLRHRTCHTSPSPSADTSPDAEDDAPPHHLVPTGVVLVGLLLSGILCISAILVVFPHFPLAAVILCFLLALVLSIVGVRALGQTDLNPVSGISKVTQLLFALLIPAGPHAIAINLVAGAVSEAGAQQAGDIMQDLKTGHLLRASPRAQFAGQLVGGAVGAILSAGIYRLYASVYDIPGDLLQVPTAYVWVDCARLVYGDGGLPDGAWLCSVVAAVLCALATSMRMRGYGGVWVPGGVAVAVGMYNVPSFTLARAVGGAVQWWWSRRGGGGGGGDSSGAGGGQQGLVVVASGLILGEGVVGVVNLVLEAGGVWHL